MAVTTTAVAIGALVVAAAGTAVAVTSANKQAKEQRKAADEAKKRDMIVARQQQAEELRKQQIARAQAIASGAAQGNLEGSAAQGGLASMATGAQSNQSFVDQINTMNSTISSHLQSAADAGFKSTVGSQVAGLGMAAFGATGQSFGSIASSFSSTAPKGTTRGAGYVPQGV
ncbi:putative TMhelix containing protein [Vibrio phage 275E43-1]|nr:putative TMhelix containing protein [Vibrio phage 275E43-1]